MSETGQLIIKAVRAVAARNPTHTYVPPVQNACEYVESRHGMIQPSCIIGHALWELGMIDANLYISPNNRARAMYLPQLLNATPEECSWLALVQREQDWGRQWGEAVVAADRIVGGRR